MDDEKKEKKQPKQEERKWRKIAILTDGNQTKLIEANVIGELELKAVLEDVLRKLK